MNPESPSFRQITEQHDAEKKATVLTRRKSGEIQTAKYSGVTDEHGRYYVELNEVDEHGDRLYRAMTPENLSDDGQAQLAEELATSRVISAEQDAQDVSEEVSESTREVIEQSVDQGNRHLTDFGERATHQLAVVEEIKTALNAVRYQDIDKRSLQNAYFKTYERFSYTNRLP